MSQIVFFLALFFAVFTPLKIISEGYLPYDDALRHAAKAVSGKNWQDILVLREEMWLDSHPGWHSFLEALHKVSGADTDQLVAFSIFFFFAGVVAAGIFCGTYPELFLLSLIFVLLLHPTWALRLGLGRPLLASMGWLIFFLKLSEDKNFSGPLKAQHFFLTVLTALVSWFHCQWYLYLFPLAAVFISGNWRNAIRLTCLLVPGIILGALLTGHPVQFFYQTFLHAWRSLMLPKDQEILVPEFQQGALDFSVLSAVMLLLLLKWGMDRKVSAGYLIKNPAFILMLMCWILGAKISRFWLDWGIPSFLCWTSLYITDFYSKRFKPENWKRIFVILLTGGIFYFTCTFDYQGRWSECLSVEYLNAKEPVPPEWLPEKGGIIYCDLTSGFNWTFFRYPKGDWKYILGFEASMMPEEDLNTFHQIRFHPGDASCYIPWVKKMTPKDRLLLMQYYPAPPDLPELEWHALPSRSFIGRLKRER